jgi:predicted phosphodiesterase
MRLHIASDLHLHKDKSLRPDARFRPTDASVLVLAGDIDYVERVARRYAHWPYDVLYVMGNHDLYHLPYETAVARAMSSTQSGRVRMLERSTATYDSVRFHGCCLWTDFSLVGDVADVMALHAENGADYRCLRRADGKLLIPADILAEHRSAVRWLERSLAQPFDGKHVVISHHAPHRRSLNAAYGINWTSASFASDLSGLMKRVSLWVHGHVHDFVDYKVNRCRIVCNAAGSVEKPNKTFMPDFVVEV